MAIEGLFFQECGEKGRKFQATRFGPFRSRDERLDGLPKKHNFSASLSFLQASHFTCISSSTAGREYADFTIDEALLILPLYLLRVNFVFLLLSTAPVALLYFQQHHHQFSLPPSIMKFSTVIALVSVASISVSAANVQFGREGS